MTGSGTATAASLRGELATAVQYVKHREPAGSVAENLA